jgi:chromosome segregation ATPase
MQAFEDPGARTDAVTELEREKTGLEDSLAHLSGENDELAREQNALRERFARLSDEHADLAREKDGLAVRFAHLCDENAKLARENLGLTHENARLGAELVQPRHELENLRARVVDLQAARCAHAKELAELHRRLIATWRWGIAVLGLCGLAGIFSQRS